MFLHRYLVIIFFKLMADAVVYYFIFLRLRFVSVRFWNQGSSSLINHHHHHHLSYYVAVTVFRVLFSVLDMLRGLILTTMF